MRVFIKCLCVMGLFLGIAHHSQTAQNTSPTKEKTVCFKSKVYAIQTNVTDLDRAVSFYSDLGFELTSKDYYPQVAPMMNGKTLLALHKVEKICLTNPNGARTTLNMAVKSLDSIINDFKNKGIEIIHNKPQKAAMGIWKAIRDPFGNIVNLMEFDQEAQDLVKPEVYNASIVVTDMDRAVNFYDNLLGFDILSVKFYPPVIPLRTEGVISNIALHESAKKISQIDYPKATHTFLVIQVENLASAMDYLKRKGVEFIHNTPQRAAIGNYVAFKDPFGLVHELVELRKH